jgi:hypothetical protein
MLDEVKLKYSEFAELDSEEKIRPCCLKIEIWQWRRIWRERTLNEWKNIDFKWNRKREWKWELDLAI